MGEGGIRQVNRLHTLHTDLQGGSAAISQEESHIEAPGENGILQVGRRSFDIERNGTDGAIDSLGGVPLLAGWFSGCILHIGFPLEE